MTDYALKMLGSQKENAVYVGDSDVDIATARNGGLPFIGVSWGFRGREFLVRCGASVIIDSPSELTAVLNEQNKIFMPKKDSKKCVANSSAFFCLGKFCCNGLNRNGKRKY